jgi:hypothetical protein
VSVCYHNAGSQWMRICAGNLIEVGERKTGSERVWRARVWSYIKQRNT